MKNRIIIIMIALLVLTFVYRVKTISNTEYYPQEIQYYLKEEVVFGNDFYDSIDNNMEGYSVTFLDYELLEKSVFLEKYHLQEDKLFPTTNYVLVVSADFCNKTNKQSEEHGINAAQFILQDNAYMTFASRDLISEINEGTNYSFSLKPNSEKNILIPFCIDLDYISIDRLKKGKSNIVVTLYPKKKAISLKERS